ncbi:hypothetical protein PFICI_05554 [Pestalotiopsis fici W106-1]|uniref:Iron-sulfur cluster assembly factor IBA57 homolog, mitochondrial n=1 Tax=Pestalotiopsis fici (strain W106-1 / CGMCC3.15140) TaxID=1229662 RepID=W3XC61_PESFW|nr:uncharacterized protein PFICI_05554 [Pestalotiopsis fici W106-1]ETS83678.1 hypothetical protein PFICI_05554 [Pestalotiopsis fici W106-1]
MKSVSAAARPLQLAVSRRARPSLVGKSSFRAAAAAEETPRRRFIATQTSQPQGHQQHPDPPPAIGFAPLPNRSLIAIAGVDAPKFLQGLVTASIYKQPAARPDEPRDEGFYTAFLTAQGRVLHDVFIHPNPQFHGLSDAVKSKGLAPNHSFLVEVSRSQVDALFALIRRYKLRSSFVHRKVELDEASVYSYWNEPFSTEDKGSGMPDDLSRNAAEAYITHDSRAPDLGWRVITSGKSELQVDAEQCPRKTYTVRRFLRGVAEGPGEIIPDKTLPLDANIDLMGGVDFRKGCYVGQELTIRTKHRGVVRKRILPCVVYGDGESRPEELEYKPTAPGRLGAESVPSKTDIAPVSTTKKRSTGHWINGIGNIGLAMCRLQPMTDIELPGESAESPSPYDPSNEFILKWETEGGQQLKIQPFVPDWIREKIAQSAHSRPAQST